MKQAISQDSISLNERVEYVDIEQRKLKTNKRTLEYDRLINTIPLVNLLDLCSIDYNADVLSCNKVLVFNLGFDSPSGDRVNHWIYYPEKKYCFYRVGYYSNIIPSERMSLYVELGFSSNELLNIEKLFSKVLADLKEAGVISNQKIVSSHYIVMNPAYVHINKKGIEEVARLKQLLSSYDIYSIGRYGSWNYSSIEDNILEAKDLSEKLRFN